MTEKKVLIAIICFKIILKMLQYFRNYFFSTFENLPRFHILIDLYLHATHESGMQPLI